jgi:tight adherence protein C
MDTTTILIALPLFFLAYQAVGLIMEARANQQWGQTAQRENVSQQTMKQFSQFSSKLVFNRMLLRKTGYAERLDLLLLRSGYPFGWKAEDFLLVKEIGLLFMSFVVWYSGMGKDTPIMLVIFPFLGFWLPDLYMKVKGTERQAVIQRLLPGFVDLMALAMESGLDLMAAVERILAKMKPSALKDELGALLQENRLGTPRKEALQHLAFRVNLQDIQSLTSMIIQSEELGTGLAGVLRSYAEDMRNRRVLRAEEIAGKMPVKLLFPMMVFFFPIVFVIIFGPLALNFMTGYK